MAFRSSTSITPGNGTSAAPAVPTGAASGDIAVVGIYKESTSAITPPAGFTLKSDLATSPIAQGRLTVYWKRLTAADTGTYSFSWSGATWRGAVCGLWSGRVASGDPFDGTVGTAESTAGVTTLNVSTSPGAANGDAVGMWTNFNGGASFTPPTNYTEQQDTPVITLDSRDAVASGSTGNVTATSTITDFMKAFLGVLAVASSGTTGTAAVTEADDASTASGQLGYSGSSAATEAADTSSTTGQLGYSGAAAVAQASQVAAASGTHTAGGSFSGTIAVTQASQTSSGTGQLGYSGTSARTQANQTSAASGSFAGGTTGSAAVTQANQTSAATGKLGYSGTSSAAQAPNTSTGAGIVANPVTGSIAAGQASQTAAVVAHYEPLVTFGTASAGVGISPSSHPNLGLAPLSVPAVGSAPSAIGVIADTPTSTGA